MSVLLSTEQLHVTGINRRLLYIDFIMDAVTISYKLVIMNEREMI